MMRGSSGAQITIRSDYVTKAFPGNERLYQQALYLQLKDCPFLPEVYQVRRDYYTMEVLSEPPYELLDHTAVLNHMIAGLDFHIWSTPASVKLDHDALTLKIIELTNKAKMPELRTEIFKMRDQIDWNVLHTCRTHGDATFDNVMIRPSTGQLVLIDPIPAVTTLGIPDLRSADFGHILRSCFGFEFARYDESFMKFSIAPDYLKLFVGDENEWRATVFWCLIHFLRVLPYMPPTCYDQMRVTTLKVKDYALETLCFV